MSTIERAAEKLAKKKLEAAANQNPQSSPQGGADLRANEPAMQPPLERSASVLGNQVNAPRPSYERPAEPVASRTKDGVTFRLPAVPTEAAELNLEELQEKGFITPLEGRSNQSQEFRRIKRQLLNRIDRAIQEHAALTSTVGQSVVGSQWNSGTNQGSASQAAAVPPPNLVMVTSALPGEGKTFISTNLAFSLAAEVDREVLLIDTDIAKADATRNFGISNRVGLGQILKDPTAVKEAHLSTNVSRLTLIGAGQYHDNLDELFASELMEAFARAVAEQNPERIVLFDAPPLLVTTEAAVLSQYVGRVLLVVESNRTPKEAVSQALAELHDCDNVNLVLNKTSPHSRFGYGYGYGYASQGTTQEIAVAQTGTHS